MSPRVSQAGGIVQTTPAKKPGASSALRSRTASLAPSPTEASTGSLSSFSPAVGEIPEAGAVPYTCGCTWHFEDDAVPYTWAFDDEDDDDVAERVMTPSDWVRLIGAFHHRLLCKMLADVFEQAVERGPRGISVCWATEDAVASIAGGDMGLDVTEDGLAQFSVQELDSLAV